MKIHTFDQYSPEWWAARTGVITASEVGPFVVNSGKVAEGARLKLICKKIGELAGELEEVFPNDAMKRGTALEPIAREEYARITGAEVKEVGFISHDSLPLGCSPDGLIYAENGGYHGLEIKCPSASTIIGWHLEGTLPEAYKCQVHMSMILAEAEYWDFFAFCPRVHQWEKTREAWTVLDWTPGAIPPLKLRIYRNAFTAELEQGLRNICGELSDVRRKMSDIYKSQQPTP